MVRKGIILCLLAVSIYAQKHNSFWPGDPWTAKSLLYIWQAQNGSSSVGEGSTTITGIDVKTKTKNKCLGSSNRTDWMIWWTEDVEQIMNGTFNNNLNNWDSLGTPNLRWVSSGGGFTGAAHLRTNAAGDAIITNTFTVLPAVSVHLTANLNIISNTASHIYLDYYDGDGVARDIFIYGTGTKTIDTTITSYFLENEISIGQSGAGNAEFYIDNISLKLTSELDSSRTISQDLATVEQAEYFWYHSLFYTTKGQQGVCAKDTIYSKDGVDSFITPTNRPTNFVATGDTSHIDLTWGDASFIETGYAIERDTVVGGGGFVAIDTTAANAVSYVDINVIEGGTYRYRMRTIASTNSAYTDIEYATVLSSVSNSYLVDRGGGKILDKGRVSAIIDKRGN